MSGRVTLGTVLPPLQLPTLSHGTIDLPQPSVTHLQFRRFAGCPICNLHVREFAASLERLQNAGVRPIAFFHSSAETMRPFQGDLPFPVVPDLERTWFQLFGVERSITSWLHPAASWRAAKGLFSVPNKLFVGEGGHDGLPADFLLDAENRVVALRYGTHAADDWSVDDVLSLAAQHGGRR